MYCCCQTDVLLAFVYEGILMGWFNLVCCGCSPEIPWFWNLNSDFFATTSCERTKSSKYRRNITFSDNGTNTKTDYTNLNIVQVFKTVWSWILVFYFPFMCIISKDLLTLRWKKSAISTKGEIKYHRVCGFITGMRMMLMYFCQLQCAWVFWLLKPLRSNEQILLILKMQFLSI